MRRVAVLGLLMMSASTACGAPPLPVSDIVRGIKLRGGEFGNADDHLVELVVHEDHVYIANSNRGVTAMRLEPDGSLTRTEEGAPESAKIRCTSLAVHAPSDTLYCGSDEPYDVDVATVRLADLSTPGQIVWRESFELEHASTRDLEVVGERLLIHQFHDGLWTADIGPDGGLSNLVDTGVVGNARSSVAVGAQLVSLFADVEGPGAQLRLLDPGDWSELDRLSLVGPALGLSADAGGAPRVAVGLGSGGMALVEVEQGELRLAHTLEPPAVVTQGLVDGDVAVAVTLSGVFAWTLPAADDSSTDPRMFGFAPSGSLYHQRAGNMLHGLVHAGEVLTSDWLYVERWALEPSGEVVALDVPRGIYAGPEGPFRWRVRNPGRIPLRAEFWLDGEPALTAMVEPGELVELELPESLRAAVLQPDEPSTRMIVRAYDPKVPSEGEPLSATIVALAQRDPNSALPPATGDRFPPLRLAELDLEQTYDFPLPEGSQTIWMWPDCALMWPQLEDLAWLGRQGIDLGRGTPVILAEYDLDSYEFVEQWGLDGARFGIWGSVAPPEVDEANAEFGDNLYDPFFIPELPGDAMPTDYVIDAQGTVRSIERMYRGPWTLVAPWPWD